MVSKRSVKHPACSFKYGINTKYIIKLQIIKIIDKYFFEQYNEK